MTRPIVLTDEFKRNIKRSSWSLQMIFNSFTEHIYRFQTLDEWNQLALANPIHSSSWAQVYAVSEGFMKYGEEIIDFYPQAIVRPADQSLNTIKEFIEHNLTDFFYEDYGVNAHNLLLEFIFYLGIRLNTTFEESIQDVEKFVISSGYDPQVIEYSQGFKIYFDACDKQNCGTKKERNLHKFGFYSLEPMMAKKDFAFFCKLIYSANLCRAMNRFTLGALDLTEEPHHANPFGFSADINESYHNVISNPSHEFGTIDFLGIHYGEFVDAFEETLLIENKLDQFIPRVELLEIVENPFDSYFSFLNTFLNDYLPSFIKINRFSKANKSCQEKVEKQFYQWAQKPDNQEFILDVISHNISISENDSEWFKKLNNSLLVDNSSNRLILSNILDVEKKSVFALSPTNWQLLADEYHKFYELTFTKPTSIPEVDINPTIIKSKKLELIPDTNLCLLPTKPIVEPRQKFIYTPHVPLVIEANESINLNTTKTFKDWFPSSLFVFDSTKIEEVYLEQSNVRSMLELVSNAFVVAKDSAKVGSNILHRFVAITLFPDKFLEQGAIIPKGKVKVFQANQYPYFEGDVEITLSQKVRMFMRIENSLIRIVSFGNPNYH